MKFSTWAGLAALVFLNGNALAELDDDNGKINYMIGTDVGRYLHDTEIDFDQESFLMGLLDSMNQKDLKLTQEQINQTRQALQTKLQAQQQAKQEKMMAEMEKQKVENLEKGNAFLAEMKAKDGVSATASGLLYEVIEQGDGNKPGSDTATVVVHYTGTLIDGTKFDSSYDRGQPATFALNQVIKGWTEGLQLMNAGSKYRFYIPPDLAYGSDSRPGNPIGPNSTLIFDVELIEVK